MESGDLREFDEQTNCPWRYICKPMRCDYINDYRSCQLFRELEDAEHVLNPYKDTGLED